MKTIISLVLIALFVPLSLGAQASPDPSDFIQKIEKAYIGSKALGDQSPTFKTLLKDLELLVFKADPLGLIVTPSSFDESKASWTIGLMSTDPQLPFKGSVVYTVKDASLVEAHSSETSGLPDLIADGRIKARLVYRLAFTPVDNKPKWSLFFVSTDLGYLEKGTFMTVVNQGLSGTTYLTFTSDKRQKPQTAQLSVGPLVAAKGKTASSGVIVYGRPSCGNTSYLRSQLDRQKIQYTFYNIDTDDTRNGEMWSKIWAAKGQNVGSIGLPVVDASGSILIAPEIDEVTAKLGNKPSVPAPVKPEVPTPTALPSSTKDYNNFMLSELNLARTNPKGYAEKRLRSAYDEGEDNGAYEDLLSRKPVGKLSLNTQLNAAADKFAKYLAQKDKFSHEADGRTPFQRMKAEGYTYSTAGENLACGSYGDQNALKSPEKAAIAFVLQLIIDEGVPSLGHRKNILNGSFKEVGVGFGRNPSSRYQNYTVQDFGTKR